MLKTKRNRYPAWLLLRSSLFVPFLLIGCGDWFQNNGTLFDFEAPLSFEAEGPDLNDLFKPDYSGFGYLLEGMTADDPVFNRVGFMIDSDAVPSLEVRVSAGESWSEWVPVTVNWTEDILHTAHADLPHGGDEIQLRLLDMAPEQLFFMAIEGFIYKPDIIDEFDIEPGLESLSRYLAANRSVDVTRSDWNARPTNCSTNHNINRITVHHTATPNNDTVSMAARMRSMQNYHMNSRGWCDIAYHFNIGQDGRVYQARDERLLGTHVANHNRDNGGVGFIGDFRTVLPSNDMMHAGARVLNAIGCHYNFVLDRNNVKAHRELGQTSCPGDELFSRMNDLVRHSASLSCSGDHNPIPDPDPPPGNDNPPGDPPPSGGNAMLQGIVYVNGDTSNRITNATVTVNGHSISVNRNGYYSISVPAGTHNITASAPGYHRNTVQRNIPAGSQTWGSVPLRPHTSTGSSENMGRLVGVVYEAPNAMDRLANATVTLSNGESAVTGRDGYFSFDVPAGTYTITASRPGYGMGSVTRRISAGETRWGSVALSPEDSRGELVGVIFEEPSTSNRLSGATVQIHNGPTLTTGPDGTYRAILPAGTYRITASLSGYLSATVFRSVESGVTLWASIGLNRVSGPEPQPGDETGTIIGIVYLKPDTSDRIPGANVWTNTGQSTNTDNQGVFTLNNVPAGDVTVNASAAGYTNGLVNRRVNAGQTVYASIGLEIGDPGDDDIPDNDPPDNDPPDDDNPHYSGMIKLIEPVNEEQTFMDPEFEWENITDEMAAGFSFYYEVILVDEHGNITHEVEVPGPGQTGGTTRTSLNLNLSPGFWWWAVLAITDCDNLIAASTFNDEDEGIDSVFEVIAACPVTPPVASPDPPVNECRHMDWELSPDGFYIVSRFGTDSDSSTWGGTTSCGWLQAHYNGRNCIYDRHAGSCLPGSHNIPWIQGHVDYYRANMLDTIDAHAGVDIPHPEWFYVAGAQRYGCGAILRVSNPDNGECIVAYAEDGGPNIIYERADQGGRRILDSSPGVLHAIGSNCCWISGQLLLVEWGLPGDVPGQRCTPCESTPAMAGTESMGPPFDVNHMVPINCR